MDKNYFQCGKHWNIWFCIQEMDILYHWSSMAMLYIKPWNKGETVTTFVSSVYAADAAILCLSCRLKKAEKTWTLRTSKKYFKLRIFFHSHIHLFDGLSCKQVGYIIDGMCNYSLILPFVSLAHQKYLITSHSLYFTDVLMYLRWAVIHFTLKALLP